jgi:hypothetical protein
LQSFGREREGKGRASFIFSLFEPRILVIWKAIILEGRFDFF